VVKLYHERPSQEKAAKIRHLTQLAGSHPSLLSFAAWPTSLVTDGKEPRGFLMPFAKGKEIHQLFGPRERFIEFPTAGWDFLVHVARNCAAAFDSIHRMGVVIGDVNEGNLLVTQEGMVRLIDCDSYQVQNGSHTWTCDVGIPLWTSPELQGRSFRGLRRTPNHDLFGLAVLIFKTLFMGRHPYAGIPLQQAADFMLEKAIANYMFAFSPKSPSLGLRAPPHCLDLSAFPQSYGELFERAFMRGSENRRPVAADWAQAMEALLKNIVKCGRDPSHKYPRSLPRCPWCTIADNKGPTFFISVGVVGSGRTDNAGDLWAAINRIEQVTITVRRIEDLVLPPLVGTPIPGVVPENNPKFIAGCMLLGVGVVTLVIGEVILAIALILFACGLMSSGSKPPGFASELASRRTAFDQANVQHQQLFEELSKVANHYQTQFGHRRGELRQSYERYVRLDQERAIEIQKLEQKKKDLQLRDFLDRQLIIHAGIRGLGPSRVAMLQACGIETALDVTSSLTVPGIGETYTHRLLNWRRQCESKFRYNASTPIPAQELHQLDVRINTQRNNLVSDLKQGPQILANLGAAARSRVLQLEAQIDVNTQRLAQAWADLSALE
jgi:DNA-binding helix-hairpin-helix protein with protein kinase domain